MQVIKIAYFLKKFKEKLFATGIDLNSTIDTLNKIKLFEILKETADGDEIV